MRKPLIILLVAELFLAILAGQTSFIHRKAHLHAFVAWQKNPTAETQAELDHQRRMNELARWELTAILFAGMAIITVGGAKIWRKLQRSRTAV